MPDPASIRSEIAKIETLIVSLRETLSGPTLEQSVNALKEKLAGLQAQLILN